MKVHLFTYGSLMFEPVWNRVVNGRYQGIAARAYGYQRKRINDALYPALIPGNPDEFVDGIIYLDIDCEDLRRLDLFEGDEYLRSSLSCETTDQGSLAAEGYLFKDSLRHRLSDQDWDPHGFVQYDLQTFIAEYHGMT